MIQDPAANLPMAEKAKAKVRKYERLKSGRSNWDDHWAEVIEYVIPRYHNTLHSNDNPGSRGEKRNTRVFESTAIQSNELLASALHGYLTSPSSLFFALSTGNPQLDAVDDVRLWLDDAVIKMHTVLNNSNFQTEIHEVYLSLGALGTGLMRIEEDDEFIVRFQARPIFEAYIAENFQKIVDTVYRCLRMPVRQIEQEFGPLPEDIKRKCKDEEHELEVIHGVEPADPKDQEYKARGHAFYSCWVLKDHEHVLKEEGFHEFPYVVPRWTRTMGEVYGRSPAMKVLPDIKMVQEMMKTTLRGAQLTVAPPLQLPDQGMVLPVKLTPAGQNFYRAGTTDRIEPLITNARVDFGLQLIENVQAKIEDAFFIRLLQLRDGPQMTATESSIRKEDQMGMMGPILGRQHFELLRPTVERVFGVCDRRGGIFMDPPPELQGAKIQVKYISQIARAQRANELSAFQRTVATIAPLLSAQPEVFDLFDGDQITKDCGEITGVPAKWFRRDKDIKDIRKAKAEAMQAAEDEAAAASEVDNVAKLAQAGAGAKPARA